ncbi:hypothetical protein [Nitrosomonas communis]|uniref:hypothetical protein n=1 Tax=Nitrosomonas communis TaxID=44574 RepID=UPI0026F0CDDD|nr:hypothetical protein [Nitrosomonas communis]MCO6426911.1 hypothetical protein [Nitrosomonas communis]
MVIRFRLLFNVLICIVLSSLLPVHADSYKPTGIDSILYFQAAIKDAEYCAMAVKNGELVAINNHTGKVLSNAAMTCPDMFSWKLFAEVIRDKFWSNWADENDNWPAQPYALCQAGQAPGKDACCQPGAANNDPNHCPAYPGTQHAAKLKSLTDALTEEAHQLARDPVLQRDTRLPFHDTLTPLSSMMKLKSMKKGVADAPIPSCAAVAVDGKTENLVADIIRKFNPADAESVGRVIRQTNAELTIRNKVFHDYLFTNNLYNANGVTDIFKINQQNLQSEAPYRRANQSFQDGKPASLSRVDLPPDAIMIKSNWLHHDLAVALGLPADPKQYISKLLQTQIDLQALGVSKLPLTCNLEGIHHLVAFHISSKDIPNWVWTTFEHISLPGRCDITGCNDAYGYASGDNNRPVGTADNYVKPNQHSDQLNSSSIVFNPDKGYPLEIIRPDWNKLLTELNIGSGSSTSQVEPDPEDIAWRNFRLKGSQVEFVNSIGQSTLLGNSVTEAGFMDGSSCISCHARAGAALNGDGSANFLALSVFERSLTDFGYARSHYGIPDPFWFYNDNNGRPKMVVMQTDFIWGFLNANPIVSGKP